MRTKQVAFIIVVLLLLAIPISTAFAEPLFDTTVGENETVNNDVIVFDGDLLLEEGAVVNGDVVVFNGDVETAGTINGDLVIFNGDLDAEGAAAVNGDCVLLNGSVQDDSTAGISCTNIEGSVISGLMEGIPPVIVEPKAIPDVPDLPVVPEPPAAPDIPEIAKSPDFPRQTRSAKHRFGLPGRGKQYTADRPAGICGRLRISKALAAGKSDGSQQAFCQRRGGCFDWHRGSGFGSIVGCGFSLADACLHRLARFPNRLADAAGIGGRRRVWLDRYRHVGWRQVVQKWQTQPGHESCRWNDGSDLRPGPAGHDAALC